MNQWRRVSCFSSEQYLRKLKSLTSFACCRTYQMQFDEHFATFQLTHASRGPWASCLWGTCWIRAKISQWRQRFVWLLWASIIQRVEIVDSEQTNRPVGLWASWTVGKMSTTVSACRQGIKVRLSAFSLVHTGTQFDARQHSMIIVMAFVS